MLLLRGCDQYDTELKPYYGRDSVIHDVGVDSVPIWHWSIHEFVLTAVCILKKKPTT